MFKNNAISVSLQSAFFEKKIKKAIEIEAIYGMLSIQTYFFHFQGPIF